MQQHRQCVNTIKTLAMDAVQRANSGHPGMPMGMADAATVLWRFFLKHDPADPQWLDRDRFILSPGHGSMLLYSLLHLSGYDLTLEDLKQFRQWGSKTPGHPEYGHTVGVETTTGPLGQGMANGVGMAIAERYLRETFGSALVDHTTWGIVSDGDLMEGVASEAASLAGHLGLGRLIYLYDDNHISIDGSTDIAFSEDRLARFEAYGWHTLAVEGHDPQAVFDALEAARNETTRPSLIACRTLIGHGCSMEGSEKTHGAPLGEEEIRNTKERMGWDPDQHFVVPADVPDAFRQHDGSTHRQAWEQRLQAHPDKTRFERFLSADITQAVQNIQWPTFEAGSKLATRKASAACLKAASQAIPWLIGGSADLSGSNGVAIGRPAFSREQFGDKGALYFGVREHGMASICNGISLHGGILPYCATFLIFHDYMRPAVRLSSMMNQGVIYVYSHDSIFLGEDGPTHQPTETLLALRSIPDLFVVRPGDAQETVEAWKLALARRDNPTALILTRQGLPVMDRSSCGSAAGLQQGAYVLLDSQGTPDVVLIATGSEVPIAMQAATQLAEQHCNARVVSMPCQELFLQQPQELQEQVLPAGIPRVSIEAGTTLGWQRFVGSDGFSIGIDGFGASAPAHILAEQFGFTAQNLTQAALGVLKNRG